MYKKLYGIWYSRRTTVKLKDKLLNWLLAKDELVCVPADWQKEYVKLAADKVRNGQVIDTIMEEYNTLLTDYLKKCSIKELKDMIKDAGCRVPPSADKDSLLAIAHNEYKMIKEN